MRERRKLDNEKYSEHLRKKRERDAIRRQKQKEKLDLDEDMKLQQRLKVKVRVQAFRAKKKMLASNICNSPIGSYKCVQTFAKAVSKVKKSLPESPLKRSAVVKKVISDVLEINLKDNKQEVMNKGLKLVRMCKQRRKTFFTEMM